jgi:hypothetical protein
MDAFRFAAYAGTADIGEGTGTLASGEDALNALVAAQGEMDEDEVPEEDRILFVTPTLLNAVAAVDTNKSREVMNSFSAIVKVPQSRFYTAIDLLDGTTEGETEGGYKKAAGAADINFMIVHKAAVLQYPKHTVDKIIDPEANQEADAWMFFYRAYGLADVYENKVSGIYVHHK